MFGVLKMQKFLINAKKNYTYEKSKPYKQGYSLGVFWN